MQLNGVWVKRYSFIELANDGARVVISGLGINISCGGTVQYSGGKKRHFGF